jgi:Fe2+ transport system protein FeoA
MTLDKVNYGETIEIINIEDKNIRAQAIRLGISEGSRLFCSVKLPAGPIILQRNRQEVAIGRSLAKRIKILRRLGEHE